MVKILLSALLLGSSVVALAQEPKAPTLKSILLEQLKTTHDIKDWFVPVDSAIAGLTAEQANWTDGKGNHSIAQLTSHLIFWDERTLQQFKGEKPAKYNGNNDETFAPVDDKTWPATMKKIDEVMAQWEKAVEGADDAKLTKWYSTIAHIGTHNAYHIGQILYVRKLQGVWDSSKGVK
jgi:uncharacterized damage-inducible protein DinB